MLLYEELDREEKDIHINDKISRQAKEKVYRYFTDNSEKVLYARQIAVIFENEFFHWVTNRAVKELENEGIIRSEIRQLKRNSFIKLYWNKTYRYYKKAAKIVTELVNIYSDPFMGEVIGDHGEDMILEGFVRNQFILMKREANEYKGKKWEETEHDVDFIFNKDEKDYGVEVKNTLGYMDKNEMEIKIKLCKEIGVIPIFAVRMIPKTWIHAINEQGGFALIMKYQLYPKYLNVLATRIRTELELPVDTPRRLYDGTMQRIVKWHEKNL